MVDVIAVVEQDRHLRDINGFRLEIVHVQGQHLKQAGSIGNIGFGAVGEKGKPKRSDRQMPFNPIGGFVEAKAFRVHPCGAGVLYRLGVNDDQSCPLLFF